MPDIEGGGEELPRLSPGVGCDSTAQGDKLNDVNECLHGGIYINYQHL